MARPYFQHLLELSLVAAVAVATATAAGVRESSTRPDVSNEVNTMPLNLLEQQAHAEARMPWVAEQSEIRREQTRKRIGPEECKSNSPSCFRGRERREY